MNESPTQYRLDLSYIGTRFVGWQRQPNGPTIQEALDKALVTILRHDVKTLGSSRTDTGVHAEQQVVTFHSPQHLDSYKFLRSLNALLPEDVSAYSLRIMPPEFHPILSTTTKIYRYRIWTSPVMSPFLRSFVWHVPNGFDDALIAKQAGSLIGEYDWTSFCATDSGAKTRVRRITDCKIVRSEALWEIYLEGEGFLKQMVRTIVGTLVEFGTQRATAADMASIIAGKDRTLAGKTAPAAGLSLLAINYDCDPLQSIAAVQPKQLGGFRVNS